MMGGNRAIHTLLEDLPIHDLRGSQHYGFPLRQKGCWFVVFFVVYFTARPSDVSFHLHPRLVIKAYPKILSTISADFSPWEIVHRYDTLKL